MLYLIESPRQRHVEAVARNLREADAQEATAVAGLDPVTATLQSWIWSTESFGIRDGSTPVGVGGVVATGEHNYVWLVGTPLMTNRSNYREFALGSREVFQRLYHKYGVLENAVSEQNTVHLRWLQWVGCTFGDTILINNTPCKRFTYVYTTRFSRLRA